MPTINGAQALRARERLRALEGLLPRARFREVAEGFGRTADFTLNGFSFRLQDYYVKEWAENWMAVIGVDDVEAWHAHVKALGNIRFKPPETVDDSLVMHIWDPSGVLLVLVQ